MLISGFGTPAPCWSRISACAFRLHQTASLARPATPGRAGFGPREVCADYDAIGHVLLAVLYQVHSDFCPVANIGLARFVCPDSRG